MAYVLEAVIGADDVLRAGAGSLAGATLVSLGSGLSLLPVTSPLVAALGGRDVDALLGLWQLPLAFDLKLAAWSLRGPVAYVGAEFFGGIGSQFAAVWDGGAILLGPLALSEDLPVPSAGTPISQALRRLGVEPGEHADEFDAAGLGRHRDTRDWLEGA